MLNSFAMLAATVSCYSRKDLSGLHNSLEGMLDGIEAIYHTDAAYRIAKKASDADAAVPYYKQQANAAESTFSRDAPSRYHPARYTPARYTASRSTPSRYTPARYTPSRYTPERSTRSGTTPSWYSPSYYSPSSYTPKSYNPSSYTPSWYTPSYSSGSSNSSSYISLYDSGQGAGNITFYNKFTDYTANCSDPNGYDYGYSSTFRSYYTMYCPGSYTNGQYSSSEYYDRSISYVSGEGSENTSYDFRSFNVHTWNIEHTSMDDVEQNFNDTLRASDAFADDLVDISGEIKRTNQEVRRKGQKAFDTIEETADSIEDIQERAMEDTQSELNDFFQGVANA